MCNLNLLFRKDIERHKELITPFLMCVSAVSYVRNNDGDGISVDGNILNKSINKIDLSPFTDIISKGRTFLSHQRFATSGLKERYTQPFEKTEFLIVHNGVMSELATEHSDTYNLFVLFNKTFKKINKKIDDRTKAIVKTIKKIFNEASGTFSIALYDKLDRKTYYFKNDGTKINAWLNKKKDILFISTESDNEKFLKIFDEEFKEVELKDYTIYCIPEKDKVRNLGKIKEKEWSYNNDSYYMGSKVSNIKIITADEVKNKPFYPEGLSNKKLKRMVNKNKPLPEFIKMMWLKPCAFCEMDTNLIGRDYKMKYVCEECIDEGELLGNYAQGKEYRELREEEQRELKDWNDGFNKGHLPIPTYV